MSLATYADLKAAIPKWMHRGDLSDIVPDFIAIAEQQLARELRLWGMEKTVSVTTVAGAFDIPQDLVEPTRLSLIVGGQVRQLIYVSATQFAATEKLVGNPSNYSVLSGKFVVSPLPPDGTELAFTYFAKPEALSDANPVNLWLQVSPDALLYAALVEASAYVKDDARIAQWQVKKKEAIELVQQTDERSQGAGPLRIRADNAR